ncbi:MAG: restriction endonuclease [Undibacterium sp.]|nr:restriction endonuclease [Opitutaceae bacterium]
MSKRKERQEERRLEAIVKFAAASIVLLLLAVGGLPNIVSNLITVVQVGASLAAFGGVVYFLIQYYQREDSAIGMLHRSPATVVKNPEPLMVFAEPAWNRSKIQHALGEIDWYQFEKFCAALLRSEGYDVDRKGGAQPDGGVDLVATKGGESQLVQCKHWRTWTVQEKTIRELLGSMTHFKVNRGALYTLNGWTRPAGAFAAEHGIVLADSDSLASRALIQLPESKLEELLNGSGHHCPKCEASMIWRTGNFKSFWGCSTYPRCRSILKYSGAR